MFIDTADIRPDRNIDIYNIKYIDYKRKIELLKEVNEYSVMRAGVFELNKTTYHAIRNFVEEARNGI